jgi:hypothetical protein
MAEAVAQYYGRIAAENEGIWEWEQELVRSEGYGIDGGRIRREAVVGATVWGMEKETQGVHRYEDFRPDEGPRLGVRLEGPELEGMSPEGIFQVLEQGYKDLENWGEVIFGKVEKDKYGKEVTVKNQEVMKRRVSIEDAVKAYPSWSVMPGVAGSGEGGPSESEIAERAAKYREGLEKDQAERGMVDVRDGKLGEHIGYGPVFSKKIDARSGRQSNVDYLGSGEMGKILLDFQWNQVVTEAGWAEAAKPLYEKKLWHDDGGIFEPPTIRSVADMGMQVVGVAFGAAVEAVGNTFTGLGGSALRVGIQWLINTSDDLLFATLDSVVTGKDKGEIWTDFGKGAAINAVTSAMSYGMNVGGGAAAKALGTGATALAKGMAQGAITAVGTYTQNVATSYLRALDFRTGEMDWETANGSWYSASTIAGALGAGVTAGLNTGLSAGLDDAQNKFLGGAVRLASAAGGEAAKYGVYTGYNLAAGYGAESFGKAYEDMGGLTVNLASLGALVDFAGSMTARNNGGAQLAGSDFGIRFMESLRDNLTGMGLVEMNIGLGEVSMRLGTGGIDLGGSLYDLAKRGIDYAGLKQYMSEHEGDNGDTVWKTYVYGDWTAENTAMRLAGGLDRLELVTEAGYRGYTESNGRGRDITIWDSGEVSLNALALQHEAYRDGYVGSNQSEETMRAFMAHLGMAERMKDNGEGFDLGIIEYELGLYEQAMRTGNLEKLAAYASSMYDSSADYWKVIVNQKDGTYKMVDDQSDDITVVTETAAFSGKSPKCVLIRCKGYIPKNPLARGSLGAEPRVFFTRNAVHE